MAHLSFFLSSLSMNITIISTDLLIEHAHRPLTSSSYCLSQPRQRPYWERAVRRDHTGFTVPAEGRWRQIDPWRQTIHYYQPHYDRLSSLSLQKGNAWLTEIPFSTLWWEERVREDNGALEFEFSSVPCLYLCLTVGVEDSSVLCEVLLVLKTTGQMKGWSWLLNGTRDG